MLRKIIFASVVLLLVILLGLGAAAMYFGWRDISPEIVFPKDVDLIVSLDYSNSQQIAAIEHFSEIFYENGLKGDITGVIDGMLQNAGITYEKDLKPVFGNKWKFVFGMSVPENLGPFDSPEVYFVGKFDKSASAKKLFEKILAAKFGEDIKDIKYKKDGEFEYWTTVGSKYNFYAAKYRDIIFATTEIAYLKEAVERIKNNSGFKPAERFSKYIEEFGDDNLGYAYVNMADFSGLINAAANSDIALIGPESMNKIRDVYGTWIADERGINFLARGNLAEGGDDYFINYDYVVDLINNVNADKIIFYFEKSKFAPYLKSFIQGFGYGFNSAETAAQQGSDIPKELFGAGDYYENFVKNIASFADISGGRAEEILNKPFALALSGSENILPNAVFYIAVDEKMSDDAKKIMIGFDSYIDEVIKIYDGIISANSGAGIGAFKKDTLSIAGGGFHKVRLDASVFSDPANMAFIPGIPADQMNLEFYYGVTGNNLMILALYPDFENVYGEGVLAENDDFKKALEKFPDAAKGYELSYFNVRSLMDFVDNIIEKFVAGSVEGVAGSMEEVTGSTEEEEEFATGSIGEAIKKNYYESVRPVLAAFKYLISVGSVDGLVVKSDVYIAIEKLAEGDEK